MKFQALAVVLAKQKWPRLIACDLKKDLGLDAYASGELEPDGSYSMVGSPGRGGKASSSLVCTAGRTSQTVRSGCDADYWVGRLQRRSRAVA